MKDYKELIAKLRTTKTQSKRKMLDDAADAIEHLQRQIAHGEEVRQAQAKTIMEQRERLQAAVECIEVVGEQFDGNFFYDLKVEVAIDKWRSMEG